MSITDVPDRELDLTNKVRRYLSKAKAARDQRILRWNRNYRLIQGRQWSEARQSFSWMPAPTASEIYPICHSIIGWMTDQRLMADFVPEADPGSPYYEAMSQVATDLNHVFESLWILKDWSASVEKILWDAMIYGTGFLKSLWDPAEENGLGNPILPRIDPYTIYPDPQATNEHDANFIIEARTLSMDELERRFPGKSDGVSEARENLDRREQMDRGITSEMLASPSSGYLNPSASFGRPGEGIRGKARHDDGSVDVLECWFRENETWTDDEGEDYTQDRWRVVATAGDVVLLDELAEDLWEHQGHPYSRYVLQDLGEFWGMSMVDHLASPQIALNRILASMQANAELVGNPVFKEGTRAQIPRQKMVNRPGQRLLMNDITQAEWMNPPQMPSFVGAMVDTWMKELEKISGLSGVTRGETPTQRVAQKTSDQAQEAATVRVRAMLRSLERTMRDAAHKLASLIVENYTAPRLVALVGPEGEQTSTYLKGRHFWTPGENGVEPLAFSVRVEAGGGSPTSRQARSQRAHMLFAMGVVDDEYVLEADDVPNRKAIIERKQQKMAVGLHAPPGARQAAGRKT